MRVGIRKIRMWIGLPGRLDDLGGLATLARLGQ
jgi:hypothetical protein